MEINSKSCSNLTVDLSTRRGNVELHGIVLAAGNGRRMEDFIYRYYGSRLPKQYVAFTGNRSMVQQTLDRVEQLISRENLLVVVDPKHQNVIKEQLGCRPAGTVIFQPQNRETAPGILLPLAHIFKSNPDSTVAIFPSDHFILEEDRFMEHVHLAKRVSQLFPHKMILLGMQPDAPEGEYGWIEPGDGITGLNGVEIHQVKGFHEKPASETAINFFKKGYLWNTLVMVTRCSTLWKLAKETLPTIHHRFEKIVRSLRTPQEQNVIHHEYHNMEPANISHSLLEKVPSRLLVMNVKDVFWSDWGNGTRVLETLKKIGRVPNFIINPSSREKKVALL